MPAEIAGTTVGVVRPFVLLILPGALAALVAAAYLRASGDWPRRRRAAFVLVRAVVVICLVVAAAGPYTVSERETPGDPQVRVLVDESTSMTATDANATALAAAIEAAGVPAETTTVAAGNRSRIGDGLLANVEPNASLLVYSDGRVTGGRSLAEAASVAARSNATVHAVRLESTVTDRRIRLDGPETVSAGVENSYTVTADGVGASSPATVTVRADGTPVFTERLAVGERATFTHAFDDVGTHRLTASIEASDQFSIDDTFRRTVRVVPKPRVLYVAPEGRPLGGLLNRLYNLTRRSQIPADLTPYQAVVTQDLPADRAGNVTALQRAVIDGTGYVAVGGPNAFESGGYDRSALGSLVPVESGTDRRRSANIVLLVDVSRSSAAGSDRQRGLALDALDQLGGQNRVGVVAFNREAYLVAPVARLGGNRSALEKRIRRLETGGQTSVATGLQGAADALDGAGTVILLSDGRERFGDARETARALARDGVRVVSVGVGEDVNQALLREVARATGGSYLPGGSTGRLRLLYGGDTRGYESDGLSIVDSAQFVTTGLDLTADPPRANDVSVKPGADYLVATGAGTPAAAQWRYGLGRVVAITAYGSDGSLGGLLSRPDSLLLSRSVNWAVGDPTAGTDVVTAADTRVGEATTVVARGSRPARPPAFRRIAPDRYRATVTPARVGFREVSTATYAANYPREYDAFGTASRLEAAVERTGGQLFAPTDATPIAETVSRRARSIREVRTEWDTHLLVAGLLLFVGEVLARRLTRVRRSSNT